VRRPVYEKETTIIDETVELPRRERKSTMGYYDEHGKSIVVEALPDPPPVLLSSVSRIRLTGLWG